MESLEKQLLKLQQEREEFKRTAELQISFYDGRIYQLEQMMPDLKKSTPETVAPVEERS